MSFSASRVLVYALGRSPTKFSYACEHLALSKYEDAVSGASGMTNQLCYPLQPCRVDCNLLRSMACLTHLRESTTD